MNRYRLTLQNGEALTVAADDVFVVDAGSLIFQRKEPPQGGPDGMRVWLTHLVLAPGTWVGVAKLGEGDYGGA
jgi:hypothetical protein